MDPEIGPNGPLRFRVMCRATDATPPLCNPFFDRTLPAPARLLLFDDARRYLGDVPLGDAASGNPPGPDDSRRLREDEVAGAAFELPVRRPEAGESPGVRDGTLRLSPGNYYLQAVYLKRFAWVIPTTEGRPDQARDRWHSPKANREDFRSEAVLFRVTE